MSDYERDKMQHTIAIMAAMLLATRPNNDTPLERYASDARRLFDAVDDELCGLAAPSGPDK